MDRKEIKEAAALFNTVKTMVEEVEAPVSFLNEAEEVITVELDKMPRDKKGLEEWEKAAPVKVYEAVNAIESVRIGDGGVRAIDDSMLAEYLPELVKTLYMEVKAAMAPPAEEKPAKGKKPKKEKAEKEKSPTRELNIFGHMTGTITNTIDTMLNRKGGATESEVVKAIMEKHGRDERLAKNKFHANLAAMRKDHSIVDLENGGFYATP